MRLILLLPDHMGGRSTVDGAELRLIPEFGGSAAQDVVEWLEKAELVCSLHGIQNQKLSYLCVSPVVLSRSINKYHRTRRQTLGKSNRHCILHSLPIRFLRMNNSSAGSCNPERPWTCFLQSYANLQHLSATCPTRYSVVHLLRDFLIPFTSC